MNRTDGISKAAVLLHLALLRPFVRLFSGINVTGRENLHGLDQYIIIANHNSHLDVFLLFSLLPARQLGRIHPVADKPYFSRSGILFGLVDFFFRPLWVTRGQPDAAAPLPEVARTIKDGHSVIIFPEGTRGAPGEMQKFKSGLGRLLAETPGIPIVPVFLTGPERALPKASSLLLPIWNNVIVGPPLRVTGSHREITRQLESALVELSRSESARRHKRRTHERRPVPGIAFLGIDGSGKSTASALTAAALSADSRVGLVSDELKIFENGGPRDLQPLLTEKIRHWVGAYAKKAGSMKSYKIPKLAELLLRDRLLGEAGRWYTPDMIVLDGSPLLNLLAWSVLYKGEAIDPATCSAALGFLGGKAVEAVKARDLMKRFPELAHLKRLGLTRLTLPDMVIFIDLPPAMACARITSRGELRQVHETEEKLARLRQGYLMVCEVVEKDWHIPTLVINGEISREEVVGRAKTFIETCIHKESRTNGPTH